MSFAMTENQIRDRSKTVTRRMGWNNLKPGERLNAVKKAMGLKKGEKIEVLAQIEVVKVDREALICMADELEYGLKETTKEGFPEGHPKHWPSEFIKLFCAAYGCEPEAEVTRIEFKYV